MSDRYSKDNKFFQEVTVPCYDTDAAFYLKPAAFMDLAQEMAYWAAQQLGFGYDDLQRHHTAWVIARMHFRYVQPPRWRDEIKVATWHKGASGPFYLRDFCVYDQQGNSMITGTSSWIILNVETRHMARDEEILKLVPPGTQNLENAIVEPAPKVVFPKDSEREYVGEHTIAYSDIDILGHTNNARYIVWAMDCVDYGISSSRRVKDVTVNFNKETRIGETVKLYKIRQDTQDGIKYFVEGIVDDKSSFCVEFDF